MESAQVAFPLGSRGREGEGFFFLNDLHRIWERGDSGWKRYVQILMLLGGIRVGPFYRKVLGLYFPIGGSGGFLADGFFL